MRVAFDEYNIARNKLHLWTTLSLHVIPTHRIHRPNNILPGDVHCY